MLALAVIFTVALAASLLTFFSGFGLGTLLLPVMAFYFSLPVAIAATALVHFANNIFKGFLMYKHIRIDVFIRFGLPAFVGTILGVYLLTDVEPTQLYTINYGNVIRPVYLQSFLLSLFMIIICMLDFIPSDRFSLGKNMIIPGGLLTGFFGGFTGMQGAVRSAFLTNIQLSKEEFVATSNGVSLIIDVCRIIGYLISGALINAFDAPKPIVIGISGALFGAIIGKILLKKTTIGLIKIITSICIFSFAILLALGVVG